MPLHQKSTIKSNTKFLMQHLKLILQQWKNYVIDNSVDRQGTATYTGSGVVISENGYIATNCHVIEIPKDELKESFKKSDSYKSSTNLVSDFEDFFSRSIEKCSKLYDIDKEKLKDLEEEWTEGLADTLISYSNEYSEEELFQDEYEITNSEGECEKYTRIVVARLFRVYLGECCFEKRHAVLC